MIILSSRFLSYLTDAATGRFASELVLSLILFKLPSFAALILPVGLFIGILLAYGQLYVDSEMVVIKACGVTKAKLLAYVLGPSLLVMLIVLSMTAYFSPEGNYRFAKAWDNPENFQGLGTLLPGKFEVYGSNVIYAKSLNQAKTEMEDVFLVRKEPGSLSIIRAGHGQINAESANEKSITLYSGKFFSGDLAEKDLSIGSFESFNRSFTFSKKSSVSDVDDIETISTKTLLQNPTSDNLIELIWRIGLALLVPVSAILALALSETSHRKGRYSKLLPAILLFIAYLGLFIVSKNMVIKGQLPIFSMWLPHFLFLCIGLGIFYAFELKVMFKRGSHANT